MTTTHSLVDSAPTITSTRISVVCSAYNASDHIAAALDSVLSQQGVTLELIVVNDGSVDATPRVLDDYASADSRVRIIHQENQGLTRALIAGCAAAQGEFIARLDSDDMCLPGRLRKQVDLLDQHADVSFVSCWATAIGPRNEVLYEIRRPSGIDEATEGLLNHRMGPAAHGSVMFRASRYHQVGGYRPQFYFAQDSDLWLRLAEVGNIAYVPEFLYQFRVGQSSISSKYREVQHALGELALACKDARMQGHLEAAILEQALTLRPGRTRPLKSDLVAGDYFVGSCLLKRRDPRAVRYFVNAVRRRPWMLRAWTALALSVLSHFRNRGVPPEEFSV